VEASAAMIELARQRLERNLPEAIARVYFIHSTIEEWLAPECRYNLIVTHFVLDCFPLRPLEDVIAKLAQAATPTATWLLTDFDYPSARVRRMHARLWIAAMYLFFRAFAGVEARRLSDPDPFLRSHGFNCVQRKTFQCGMVKSEVWQLHLSPAPSQAERLLLGSAGAHDAPRTPDHSRQRQGPRCEECERDSDHAQTPH
jgi:hypothetical protein